MNFAKAVKGKLTRNGILREVDSQSEIELGRHLDPSEKTSLFLKPVRRITHWWIRYIGEHVMV